MFCFRVVPRRLNIAEKASPISKWREEAAGKLEKLWI
jgi:hypothetical protein